MPRKKASEKPAKPAIIEQGVYYLPNDAAWGGFINIRLDDDQKAAFYEWIETNGHEVQMTLEDILGEGMKVAIAYDRENSCHVVSYTGALVANSNERYSCITRAGTITECLALAAWKHSQLANGEYGDFRPRTGTLNNWG